MRRRRSCCAQCWHATNKATANAHHTPRNSCSTRLLTARRAHVACSCCAMLSDFSIQSVSTTSATTSRRVLNGNLNLSDSVSLENAHLFESRCGLLRQHSLQREDFAVARRRFPCKFSSTLHYTKCCPGCMSSMTTLHWDRICERSPIRGVCGCHTCVRTVHSLRTVLLSCSFLEQCAQPVVIGSFAPIAVKAGPMAFYGLRNDLSTMAAAYSISIRTFAAEKFELKQCKL